MNFMQTAESINTNCCNFKTKQRTMIKQSSLSLSKTCALTFVRKKKESFILLAFLTNISLLFKSQHVGTNFLYLNNVFWNVHSIFHCCISVNTGDTTQTPHRKCLCSLLRKKRHWNSVVLEGQRRNILRVQKEPLSFIYQNKQFPVSFAKSPVTTDKQFQ